MSDEEDIADTEIVDNKTSKYAGFKFVSFSKCVAQIGGDNSKLSRRLMLTDSTEETFFTEALTKWNDQDFGVNYCAFVDEIPTNELQTYAQLLHHRDTIANALLKHMKDESSKSIPAFCELLSALARDLREEFSDFMWPAFEVLTNILDFGERDKDSVEAAFYCLSMLIKILWKKLAKNIKKTFSRFIPLFGSSREYVRRFASEGFAFLMRKMNDLRDLAAAIVHQAFKVGDKYLQDGCATLFFNVYKGWSGGFHSAADQQISELINGVLNIDQLDVREYGFDILTKMTELTVLYVKRTKSDPKQQKKLTLELFEKVVLSALESTRSMERASYLMRLIPILFAEKNGKLLFSSEKHLFALFERVLQAEYFRINSHFVDFVAKSLNIVFAANQWNLPIRELFVKIAKCQRHDGISTEDLLLDLFFAVRSTSAFDLYILPSVGELSSSIIGQKPELEPRLISLYALVCSERRPLDEVVGRARSSFFDVSRHASVKKHILSQLASLSSLPHSLSADLVCTWPWLFSSGEKIEGSEDIVRWLEHLMEKKEGSGLAYIAGASLFQVKKELLKSIGREKFEALLKHSSCSESSILLYRLYILSAGEQTDIKTLLRVAELFSPAYFCANASRRKAALEVLASFRVEFEGSGQVDDNGKKFPEPEGAFSILLAAESAALTDSRGRLLQFRKLLHGSHERQMPKGHVHELEHIVLRVGLAQFFVQFTLLWPGMHELLISFARGMDIDAFWKIMAEVLGEVQNGCRQLAVEDSADEQTHPLLPRVDLSNRFDYLSARIQILRFIGVISDLAERRTRILSPLLLDIYENDFLQKNSNPSALAEDDSEEKEEQQDQKRSLTNKELCKALIAFLDVFAKFSDAKSVYLEPKIREMYDNLLTFGNDGILRSTVACIFSYKNKALAPYRENFDGILEEKTFREQLVLFKILEDEGDAVVHVDHRATVMPVLLRLLFGKLRIRAKKGTTASRRTAIFRYLGGCRPNELQLFIDILFEPVLSIVGKGDGMFEKMEEVCRSEENLSRVKLECVKDALGSVSELVRRIARVIVEEQQTQLLRVLLTTAVVIRSVINVSSEPEYRRNKAKDLRVVLTETLSEFFGAFPERPFSSAEIRQLLAVTVECYLEKGLSRSGDVLAIAPQSTLKLLATFSRMPSYSTLLSLEVRPTMLDSPVTLLGVFISPLLWNGLSPIMLQMIRGALLNLLTLADEKAVTSIDEFDHLKVDIISGTNYGTSLVVKHLSPILTFLANALEDDSKGKHIAQENMEILNRLSDFVSDGEIGRRMAMTLLAQLERSISREEMAQKMLNTLGRLVKLVEKPYEFTVRLAKLFSVVDGRLCREALMSVLRGIIENPNTEQSMKDLLAIAADLDAWDGRRVDEPDHDKRHGAYSKLFEMWSSDATYDTAFLSLVAHTHTYTLSHTTDIALRSSSASNLRSLAEHVGRNAYSPETKAIFVDKHVIPLLLKGFRNSAENVREECVRCLVTLIESFPTHQQLSAFLQLQNKDEDLDFFTNLIHIQTHRRQRAISRLVNHIKEGKVTLPFEVMNRFLVPIIYHYLIAMTSKISALSDECLRLLNVTLELAPWPKYISALDHWIGRLDKENDGERPIVRVVVAVIDAFHFEVADAAAVADEDGSNATAIAIRDKIQQHLVPRLQKCINGKAAALGIHRKARTSSTKYYNEDDDIIRAPVALATVKLLQKMPESILKQHLHGVVLKLCWLMISRSSNVRETARKVALQVCDCLGPRYLPYIIKEMKLIMNKGFQLHVMIFTVHSLIFAMQARLKTGDLDPCLEEILDLSVQDQFEDAADEKEVGSIKAEVAEAKGNKTPETMLLLGKFTSASALGGVLDKFKEVLDTKSSSKVVTRVGNLLAKFANGIKENADLTPATQLVLVFQVLTSNIEKMENANKKVETDDSNGFRPTSCLILPDAPKRVGALVKTSVKSRVHVFVEFALQLLSYLITGKVFDPENAEDIARLDPFVAIVNRCLSLKYDRVVSLGVRCMTGLLHMEMPAMQGQLKSISERLFVLLSNYSVIGNAGNKHSVLQLNHLIFKAFTRVISMGTATLLTKKHVALLLSYVETDVLDSQKQATAFSLIKAIVRKKIEHERIPEVMQHLAELSISNQQGHIRTQCRDTLCEYVGNHPQAGEPKKHLEFFAAQLEYEFEDGRLSAAETLHQLFNSLLPKVLDDNCFFCLLKLCARLVNDEVPKCRKYVGMTVRKLLEGVSAAVLENVAAAGCDWLESEKETSRAVGAELLVQLSHVEGERFTARMQRVLTAVADRMGADDLLEENSESTWINLLDGLVLMLKNCGGSIDKVADSPLLCTILARLPPLVKCGDSVAVCLAASSFIGQCISGWKSAPKAEDGAPSIEELVGWMCWQLKDRRLTQEVAEQASKNIVFLSKWLSEEDFASLVKRLSSICRFEISHQPKEALKRLSCFKLAAALAVRDTEGQRFEAVAEQFLPLFVREMNRKSAANTDDLCNLATEIGEVVKARLGEQEYGKRLADCQKELLLKAEDRKRKIKELAVTAPVDLAEFKRRKNQKKGDAKKRKLDEMKPHRVVKRKYMEKKRLMQDED